MVGAMGRIASVNRLHANDCVGQECKQNVKHYIWRSIGNERAVAKQKNSVEDALILSAVGTQQIPPINSCGSAASVVSQLVNSHPTELSQASATFDLTKGAFSRLELSGALLLAGFWYIIPIKFQMWTRDLVKKASDDY